METNSEVCALILKWKCVYQYSLSISNLGALRKKQCNYICFIRPKKTIQLACKITKHRCQELRLSIIDVKPWTGTESGLNKLKLYLLNNLEEHHQKVEEPVHQPTNARTHLTQDSGVAQAAYSPVTLTLTAAFATYPCGHAPCIQVPPLSS
jgi:hypothetical protein